MPGRLDVFWPRAGARATEHTYAPHQGLLFIAKITRVFLDSGADRTVPDTWTILSQLPKAVKCS